MWGRLLIAVFISQWFFTLNTNAQVPLPADSVKKTNDTVKVKNTRPRNAALLSAIIPGAGQVYNRKYWKPPIIYAGFAGMGYFIYKNNYEYQQYRTIYRTLIDTIKGNEIATSYTPDQLRLLKEGVRRNRDFFIIVSGLWYVINIVDAMVDAHLYDFDVSDNLSLHISPFVNYTTRQALAPYSGLSGGVNFRFTLKH
ncbi:MAG: hypothetical protein IT239_02710 [Bacteroidia bacterium]|nr:hypothetical protein [Bacteroidia bacterium]